MQTIWTTLCLAFCVLNLYTIFRNEIFPRKNGILGPFGALLLMGYHLSIMYMVGYYAQHIGLLTVFSKLYGN